MYTLAYRNLGIFQENVVNRMLADIVKYAKPRHCDAHRRFHAAGRRPHQGHRQLFAAIVRAYNTGVRWFASAFLIAGILHGAGSDAGRHHSWKPDFVRGRNLLGASKPTARFTIAPTITTLCFSAISGRFNRRT